MCPCCLYQKVESMGVQNTAWEREENNGLFWPLTLENHSLFPLDHANRDFNFTIGFSMVSQEIAASAIATELNKKTLANSESGSG